VKPKLRALIVEDSEDDTLLLVREIRRGGFELEYERVASEAALRAALPSGGWDVILADYNLPAFSGTEALRLVRESGRDIPFIFVSGTIGEELAVAAMKAGASDYVMKGNLQRLVPAIERELREAEVRRRAAETEAALDRSEERFAKVFQASPVGILIATLEDWRVVDANPAALAALGYAREDVVDRRAADLALFSDPAQAAWLARQVRTAGTVRHLDLELRTRAGDLRPFLASCEGLDLGSRPCLLLLLHDMSERRRLEEQLRQAQKMEAIGRLAGGVAHDFNNLLTVITGYCELLLQDLPAGDAAREEVLEIQRAAGAASTLTSQLLAFARRQVQQPRVLDLNRVVASAERMLGRLLGEDVVLSVSLAPDLGRVRADPTQVEQVLLNLAINARDAMPRGGRLTVETANAVMDEGYVAGHRGASPGRYVMVAVSDTGVGMDAETRARLFEPFFTTKAPGKGTGLGLATVYGIVKQSGGFIWVYSEPGLGTTFKVYLPRVDAEPEESPPRSSPQATARGHETILVVEDSPGVRRVAREALERNGYTVLEASDGPAALATAARHPGPIHLLLTDVVLPGLGGPGLARALGETRPELRVLYTSGFSAEASAGHGVIEPDAHYLPKPFAMAALLQKVREVLDLPRE
jgi:PAS domain S-box-containing protein